MSEKPDTTPTQTLAAHFSEPAAFPPASDVLQLTDIVDAGEAAARQALDPQPQPGHNQPPPDLMQIISEAVAVYAAAKAGGKAWWRSKGMWGAVGCLVGGLAAVVSALVPNLPGYVMPAIGVFTVFCAQLAAHGRATATGPIR